MPSERVTNALVNFWLCIRSTIAASVMLGRTVLGPAVIAAWTATFLLRGECLAAEPPEHDPGRVDDDASVPAGGAYLVPNLS